MRSSDTATWHRCAYIHASLWSIGLTKIERDCYLYLCSYCHDRWRISAALMAKVLGYHRDNIGRALHSLANRRMVLCWKLPGNVREYQVTLRTSQGWGLPLANGNPLPSAEGNPCHSGRALPTPLNDSHGLAPRLLDEELLSLGSRKVRLLPFHRKPAGHKYALRQRERTLILELMRHLVATGYNGAEQIERLLDHAGEYLGLRRDVLADDGRDYRAKTLGAWLAGWNEQIHRAETYMEMRDRNVVRMPVPAVE